MRVVPILLLSLTLAGCSNKEVAVKAMEAINTDCKKHSGELTVVFEAGPFGNTIKVSCTARVYP